MQPKEGTVQHWDGARIAYVSRHQSLFTRSIQENVRYGAPASLGVGDPDIRATLAQANTQE
jgi:ABC-type multidrug transport system fused ATPase/permease subunit